MAAKSRKHHKKKCTRKTSKANLAATKRNRRYSRKKRGGYENEIIKFGIQLQKNMLPERRHFNMDQEIRSIKSYLKSTNGSNSVPSLSLYANSLLIDCCVKGCIFMDDIESAQKHIYNITKKSDNNSYSSFIETYSLPNDKVTHNFNTADKLLFEAATNIQELCKEIIAKCDDASDREDCTNKFKSKLQDFYSLNKDLINPFNDLKLASYFDFSDEDDLLISELENLIYEVGLSYHYSNEKKNRHIPTTFDDNTIALRIKLIFTK